MSNVKVLKLDEVELAYHNIKPDEIVIRSEGVDPASLEKELEEWESYLKYCLRTWNSTNTLNIQVANAALGLLGELAEYLTSPSEDELGDVLYYRAILCYLMGRGTHIDTCGLTVFDDEFNYDLIFAYLADVGKKVAFHDKFSNAKLRHRFQTAMSMLDAVLTYDMSNVWH